jgi:hypothetical protein
MTGPRSARPHDRPLCGARKWQPIYPGQTCARPAGWGTEHVGFGRCKLHGGATPYRHGRYSRVVRELYLPSIRWKLRAHSLRTLRSTLTVLVPDPERRDELLRLLLAETGLDQWPEDSATAAEGG